MEDDWSVKLTGIGEGILECEQPLRVAGFELNHRMTVMVSPAGEVMVHSPVALRGELKSEVSRLGQVKWIVAPSRMHDLFLKEWVEAFPEALLLHSPDMKIRGIAPQRMMALSDESGRLFGGGMETLLVRGMPKINEVVFLHPPSSSLIVADLMFNLPPASGFQKLMQKANGVYQRLAPSRLFKMCIADQAAFRGSLKRILEWDFEGIILGHGANVPRGGRERLGEVFAR